MDNKQLFIEGYLERICTQFGVKQDIAFEIFSISAILDKTFQEVYDEVLIQGSKDGGIDGAIFIDQNNSYQLLVFQCKNTTRLKQNEIEKFRNDVEQSFVRGVERPNTQDLQAKIDEYKQLSKDGYLVEIRRYFLYAGSNNDPASANSMVYSEFHKPDDYEIWDSESLYHQISKLIKSQNRREGIRFVFHPQSSNIILSDSQGLYTYAISNVRAANFRIEANELCLLVEQELDKNSTYDFLFSENIRGFLGLRVKPNRRMKETLQGADSILFPLLNNGITIICDKVDIPSSLQDGNYILPTHNPVIVNGLQTTRVIYEIYKENKDALRNVFVNVRLYETSDNNIIDLITDATNTQTPINYRDRVSNKGFTDYVKEVFANQNIAYIHKRGEFFSGTSVRKYREAIGSDTLLKFWYASFYERPEIAKNKINTVLSDIFDATNNEHPLEPLFNGKQDSPIYQQLLYTYRIYSYVLSRRDGSVEFLAHATELFSYGIYKYLENSLATIADASTLQEAYDYAYQTIEQIVSIEIALHQKNGNSFSYNSYFKSPKCRIDYNQTAGIMEKNNLIQDLLFKR